MVNNPHANAEDTEKQVRPLTWKDPLEQENGNPLQYFCLGNPMDRGDWWAAVRGVTKSWTEWAYTHTHTHTSTYISWDLPFGTTCLLKLFTMIICFLYRIHANIIALKKVSLNVQTILARIPICLSSHICIWIYLQFSSIVYIFLKMC